MIGFGTSGRALAKDYAMSVLASKTLKRRLRLLPKSGEVREYETTGVVDSENGDPYPLREKISLLSGDYRLITYSDLMITPRLPPDALQLKRPVDVQTEYPGK